MEHKTINLRIPPGVKWISVTYHEDLAEENNTVEKAFEEAATKGTATVCMCKSHTEPTGLDILRTRGTPVELIGSALHAGDTKTTNKAFRTTVLEYLYEKLKTIHEPVRFVRGDEPKKGGTSISLVIQSKEVNLSIQDDMNASVMSIVEQITDDLRDQVMMQWSAVTVEAPTYGGIQALDIEVDTYDHTLERTGDKLTARVSVPILVKYNETHRW